MEHKFIKNAYKSLGVTVMDDMLDNLMSNFDTFVKYYSQRTHELFLGILAIILLGVFLIIVLGAAFRVGKRLKEAKITNEKLDILNKNIQELTELTKTSVQNQEKITALLNNMKFDNTQSGDADNAIKADDIKPYENKIQPDVSKEDKEDGGGRIQA